MKKNIKVPAPFKTGDETFDRNISDIYNVLNDIVSTINASTDSSSTAKGRPGEITVVDKGNDEYVIRAFTKKGWVEFNGTTAFFVKSKS
tara:strand:- start:1186 stop:1452 length:267 start_codon:yes stop_codon:yes gene_type:complete